MALGERLVSFKRFYRWLNLTLVQQALWPLLVLLTSARGDSPEGTPMPWYLARLGAPALAAALATFVRLPPQQRAAMSAACRALGLATCSADVQVRAFVELARTARAAKSGDAVPL
jgi:hypothetical protein